MEFAWLHPKTVALSQTATGARPLLKIFMSLCFGGLNDAFHGGLRSYEQHRENSTSDGNLLTSLHDKTQNIVKMVISYKKTPN